MSGSVPRGFPRGPVVIEGRQISALEHRPMSRYPAFMDAPLSTLARALELARSGQCRSVNDVRQMLRREGYDEVHQHLNGSVINRQLIELLAQARADFSK